MYVAICKRYLERAKGTDFLTHCVVKICLSMTIKSNYTLFQLVYLTLVHSKSENYVNFDRRYLVNGNLYYTFEHLQSNGAVNTDVPDRFSSTRKAPAIKLLMLKFFCL